MARLGSKARPLVLRVQSDERAYFVAATCAKHGWQYVMGIEPDQPEDLRDLEQMSRPAAPLRSAKIERNAPCPCGSGRKYKKCCGSAITAVQPGRRKLSEVIWEYAEPLTKSVTGTEETKKGVQLAILFWNVSQLPPEQGRASIAAGLRDLADGDETLERDLWATLEMMRQRKQRYFADDERLIVKYSITETGDGLHLLVTSEQGRNTAG